MKVTNVGRCLCLASCFEVKAEVFLGSGMQPMFDVFGLGLVFHQFRRKYGGVPSAIVFVIFAVTMVSFNVFGGLQRDFLQCLILRQIG
jgi:hypothetical protein